MRALWFLFMALVALGSVYPFDFSASELTATSFGDFLSSCCGRPGRGDTVANIILFMPVGFTGVLGAWPHLPMRRRLLFVIISGTFLAFMLQVLQLYLPSRDENLQDVVWNVIGILGGAAIAHRADRLSISAGSSRGAISTLPLALIGAWLVYRLIPFVPSIDFQLFKDSVKPLFFDPLSIVGLLGDTAAWLTVAYLLFDAGKSHRLDRYFPALVAIVFALEIIIVGNSVNRANVVGAIAAFLIWTLSSRYRNFAAPVLVAMLVLSLVISGLSPFQLRLSPAEFNWLPFQGYLGGSMFINAQSAAEKVFLYGSLVYLLWKMNIGRIAAVGGGFFVVLVLEGLQTYFYGHTPEITDPLLVVFAAFALVALEKHEQKLHKRHAALSQAIGGTVSGERLHDVEFGNDVTTGNISESPRSDYKTESVNLRSFQVGFLQELSREMDETVSGVVKRVVDQYIDGDAGLRNARDRKWIAAPTGATRPKTGKAARSVYQAWERREIEFDAQTYEALKKLSKKSDISVSRVVRRMIAKFIEKLDEE